MRPGSGRFPPYVPAGTMRELCVEVLSQYCDGALPEGFCLGYVVVQRDDKGNACLRCFRPINEDDGLEAVNAALCAVGHDSDDAYQYRWLIEALIGHVAQWFEKKDVVDLEGRPVPKEQRVVLDPFYLASEVDKLHRQRRLTSDNVELLFNNAPEVEVAYLDRKELKEVNKMWLHRIYVSRWRNLAGKWNHSGAKLPVWAGTTVG